MKCLALLALGLAWSAFAQSAGVQAGVVGLEFKHTARQHAAAWFVEYGHYENEPAFRVRAHHYHAWCNGDLYLTPTRVVYVPTLTPWQKDGVTLVRREISDATPRYAGYSFSSGGKSYKFAFLSERKADTAPEGTDGRELMMKLLVTALTDFPAAEQQFLAMLTGIGPGTGDSLALPKKPLIRVLDPAGAKANVRVNASSTTQRVLGVAAAMGGVRAITVNGVPASIAPLASGVVEFSGQPMALRPGMSPVLVIATANDGDATQVAFNTITPEIRITDPEPGAATDDETVRIHGMIIGVSDVQDVHLAGQTVPATESPDGAFDFTLPKVSVNLGLNVLPGYVALSDGRRETFSTTVLRTPPAPPAYTFEQIEGGLRHGLTNARLTALVKQSGVDFSLTPELERRLRRAGANETLLEAIAAAEP
jgi:hypothetical protein